MYTSLFSGTECYAWTYLVPGQQGTVELKHDKRQKHNKSVLKIGQTVTIARLVSENWQ